MSRCNELRPFASQGKGPAPRNIESQFDFPIPFILSAKLQLKSGLPEKREPTVHFSGGRFAGSTSITPIDHDPVSQDDAARIRPPAFQG